MAAICDSRFEKGTNMDLLCGKRCASGRCAEHEMSAKVPRTVPDEITPEMMNADLISFEVTPHGDGMGTVSFRAVRNDTPMFSFTLQPQNANWVNPTYFGITQRKGGFFRALYINENRTVFYMDGVSTESTASVAMPYSRFTQLFDELSGRFDY